MTGGPAERGQRGQETGPAPSLRADEDEAWREHRRLVAEENRAWAEHRVRRDDDAEEFEARLNEDDDYLDHLDHLDFLDSLDSLDHLDYLDDIDYPEGPRPRRPGNRPAAHPGPGPGPAALGGKPVFNGYQGTTRAAPMAAARGPGYLGPIVILGAVALVVVLMFFVCGAFLVLSSFSSP